jgi:transcriptional regulator with XRE-family HTH domain
MTAPKAPLDYRRLLLDELALRKQKNAGYSLRAFARDLGISVASLSQVLSSKRKLSPKNLAKVAGTLGLSPAMRDPVAYDELEEDTFRMMSDWYYYAILSLARLRTTRAEPRWIAKRLGISPPEARVAVERLERLGFLRVAHGRLVCTAPPIISTTNEVPSAVIRRFHKQLLQLATLSIDRDPISRRQVSSMTMAVDPAKLEEAKRMVLEFRDRLTEFLECGTLKEVYTLTIQLFPMTRPLEKKS